MCTPFHVCEYIISEQMNTYVLELRVLDPIISGRFINCVLIIRNVNESSTYASVFSTQLGGIFGYVVPMISSGAVIIRWSSVKEYCALRGVIESKSMVPSHFLERVTSVFMADGPMDLVRLNCDNLRELVVPGVEMTTPDVLKTHSYSFDVCCDDILPAAAKLTIHYKILYNGDVVLHTVIIKNEVPSSTTPCAGPQFWQYTPRQMACVDEFLNIVDIDWGVEQMGPLFGRCVLILHCEVQPIFIKFYCLG